MTQRLDPTALHNTKHTTALHSTLPWIQHAAPLPGCRSHFTLTTTGPPPRRCHHFEVVGGLEWSNDPKSYASSSVATGRASRAGKVKGDDPD
jgi:hypothetical protein